MQTLGLRAVMDKKGWGTGDVGEKCVAAGRAEEAVEERWSGRRPDWD